MVHTCAGNGLTDTVQLFLGKRRQQRRRLLCGGNQIPDLLDGAQVLIHAAFAYLENEAFFYAADGEGAVVYFAHCISRTGAYLIQCQCNHVLSVVHTAVSSSEGTPQPPAPHLQRRRRPHGRPPAWAWWRR